MVFGEGGGVWNTQRLWSAQLMGDNGAGGRTTKLGAARPVTAGCLGGMQKPVWYVRLKQPSKAPEGDRVFEKLRPPRLIALFQQRIIAVGTGSMSPQPECIDGGSRFPKGREWAAVGGSKDWGK